MHTSTSRRLTAKEVEVLDPYMLMAVLGKRVIHPGGKLSTEELFRRADFAPGQRVLDVGCGVGTTAIEVARRYGARVTAVDISPIMLERAHSNVAAAGLEGRVAVERGDILALRFPDDTFDRVIAEAVTMFVNRPRAARELVRVCRPGGRILATEFLWRQPPTPEARQVFLGELCPGMNFDTLEDWVRIYEEAGLDNVQVTSGPFEMMTPTGFLQDEGLANSLAIMGRALSRACYLKKMTWLMPRMNRAGPYLGYIAVSGVKPDQRSSPVHREADRGATQTTISVETLRALLDRDEPVTVLDIRRAEARAEWAIPGSLHVDAYDALKSGDPNALADVDLSKDTPVVTVCNVGKTSMIAARQLRARGFEASSLAGGMKAWSLAWNSAEVPVPGSDARVIQMRRTGKGCLSYVIGSKGEAAVIDAALEPELYLNLANERGWTISSVLETHVHADHLSRSRKLAEMSGATLCLPDQDRVSFPFTPVRDEMKVGTATLAAMRTPGHTPESTCYLLDDKALFTGDTLFLGGVGRPDLEANPQETRARAHALHRSLGRILTLPPEILVLPGHTSEPVAFDGKPLVGTLAEVREKVGMLGLSEDAFVEAILARIPPTPPNHHRIVEANEAGLLPGGDPTDLEAGANRCAVG